MAFLNNVEPQASKYSWFGSPPLAAVDRTPILLKASYKIYKIK